MNKKLRLVWLILVTGVVLGFGHRQEVAAATITVTNTGDGAASSSFCPSTSNTTCRLRDAIAKAAPGDTIIFSSTLFSSPQRIILTNGELIISKNLTISGPGASKLTVSGNRASRVFKINSGFTVTISALAIANGANSIGAGIHNSASLTLNFVTLSGNVATLMGGGIYNLGPLTINRSTLSDNSTSRDGNGGGLFNYSSASLSNSTISGNAAKVGGGIYHKQYSLTLANCTVAGNSASLQGSGIYQYSSDAVNLRNTIVAQNTGGGCCDIQGLAINSQGYNLIERPPATINGNLTGNILNQNPLLAPLGNYGGQTPTRPLLPGSPAINAGTSFGAATTDQRQIARVGEVDIGAFESRGFTLAIASGNNQSAAVNRAFANHWR